MAIGIAPGRQEIKWGAPLVGPSGIRHDLCLNAIKYPREKTYSTNLICFWKDEPSVEEIETDWPRLRTEIETVRPRLILALGALACEWLTGYSIGKVRGNLIRPEYNRSPHFEELFAGGFDLGDGNLPTVLPTWHPAATLRITSLATDVIRDYRKIRPFLKGRYEPLQWDWRLVTRRKEAQQVLDSLGGQTVAIDVETEKDVNDAFGKVVCVAMAVEDPRGIKAPNGDPAYFAYVFPVEVLRGLRWPRKVKWLEHNMGFDNPIIKREFDIWLTGVHDTFIDSLSRDERPGRDEEGSADRQRSGEDKKPKGPGYHGLKQLSAEYNGAPPGYGDEMKKSFGKTLEEIAAPQLIMLTEKEIAEIQVQETENATQQEALQIEDTGRVRRGRSKGATSELGELPVHGANLRPDDGQAQDHQAQATKKEMEDGEIDATASTMAVDLLAGGRREPVGESSDRSAANGSDAGSASEAPSKPATKRKGKGAKAKALMRMETAEEAQGRFERFLQALYKYNAFDAVNTVALPNRLPGKPCPARDTILMPAARAYARIHLSGVPVDLERAKALQEEWTPWIEELEAELQQEAHDLGFRNTPTLKRDLAARELYEDEYGTGTWPLGIPKDVRKVMDPDERLRVTEDWLLQHGPNSWPGYEPINLGSSLQLGKLLYGKLRIKVKVRSKKTGKPSVGKEAIADIEHPFVDRMEEVRTAKHVKRSHLDPIPELVKGDGKIHPTTWVVGAVNYRRAITSPPMQQMPQEHPKPFWKKLAEVRSVVRPEPGYCLLEADYRQIELWGAALLSGDETFLADLRSGDYHTRIVREVFHCNDPEDSVVFHHTRRIAKVANFAVLYRVEENTLAKAMQEGSGFGTNEKPTTPRDAGRFIRQWYARNRTYWLWQEDLIREVKRKGRLLNPLGEERRFPLYDPLLDKQLVNWPVSSTCGAHSELSLIKLEPIIRRDVGGQILFDTHDSLLFHIPIKKRRGAARVIREVMMEPKVAGWPPLDIEFKMSETNWREMKVWDERV